MRAFISLLCYRIVFILLLPILVFALLIRSINNAGFRARISERLGLLPSHLRSNGIVVHAASVGEVIGLKAYIDGLLEKYPNTPVTITTFTPTGSAQVAKLFNDRVQHCYFPLDAWPCTWLFLKSLQPKVLVLMETELWPNLIAQCSAKQIPLQIINGRLSDNSMRSYQKLSWLITPSLTKFNQILTQSEENKANFIQLGANPDTTKVSGNLKFDIRLTANIRELSETLATGLDMSRPIWLIASTHPNDEQLVLDSFVAVKTQHPNALLIMVPRHPERFDDVFTLCSTRFNVARRSQNQAIDEQTDIWLIDTLGELLACCALADVVTMGGSFSNIGGHNPLEPALFKKAITVGHDMANFRFINQQLLENAGVIQLATSKESSLNEISRALANVVNALLADAAQREQLGQAAFKVVQMNQGASQYSLDALKDYLP